MMDNFKEDIVGRHSNVLPNILYALCWVCIVAFGLYAMLMLQVPERSPFSCPPPVICGTRRTPERIANTPTPLGP